MRRIVGRHTSQRANVEWVLNNVVDGRSTQEIFCRVGNQLGEGVRESKLETLGIAPVKLHLQGVVKAAPLAFQLFVNAPVLRKRPQSLCDSASEARIHRGRTAG